MIEKENIYIYQDTFLSLLTLIKILIQNQIKPLNLKPPNYTPTLLDNIIEIEYISKKEIITFWENRTTKEVLKTVYYVFLSSSKNKELIIYYFLLNSLKYKEKIFYMRNLKCVHKALKISQYVAHENHRFKGFTRFKELKNHILYAEIEPENNILYLLSMHFQKRLKNEYFMIVDKKRNIVSVYDKNNFYIVHGENIKIAELQNSIEEQEIELLWKNFYKTIGIKERKNDRCRMNFMPKKYWKNIIEVSDEI